MKSYNIAHFGAFDVDSFGDSLFAEIFRNEMSERININKIVLFSVSERKKSYNDNGHVYSYSQFDEINKMVKFDAIVVGGGELLHFKPITFNPKIDGKKMSYPGGYMWTFPIEKSRKNNIPILFNCVGVPYDFEKGESKILDEYLCDISYMSVRDEYSKNKLCRNIVNKEVIKCVPDSIFCIDKYYTLNKLNEIKNNLIYELKFDLNKPYIVFQYGTSYNLSEIINQLKKIKKDYNYNIILLPINYCHEDLDSLRKIKKNLNDKDILIEKRLKPSEIISIIANCSIFLGTSLHGNLIATVYGKKIIALDMYRGFVSKIDGLLNVLDLKQNIVPEPDGIYSKFNEVVNDDLYNNHIKRIIKKIQENISEHFNYMANIIEDACLASEICINDNCSNNDIPKYSYMKSYICYGKENKYIYSITSKNKNKYVFEFNINESINTSNLEFNICSDVPIKISEIKSFCNMTEIPIEPVNGFKNEDDSLFFVDYNIKYKFLGNNVVEKIIIECNIEYFSNYDNISLLRDNANNLKGHIELLLQSERNLNSQNNQLNIELNNKGAHIEQLIKSERHLNGELNNKKCHIELLLKNERELRNEVTNLKNKIEELNDENKGLKVEARNKEGHIELLLESERELERIKGSRSWRFMSYIWTVRDKIIPRGSKRRLIIKLCVKAVKHPIKFIKKCTPKRIGKFFYYLKREGVSNVSARLDECVIGNSDEKINLNITNINENKVYTVSDFEKLVFNKVENPKVSIIIPVYNQIHYTYACLKSILENTNNVSYEVIIANDCSTDITSKIEEFVENINVITSEKNLRFLLNCNNAAKYAKGEYILFLNNDTQVQKNWLSSLVSLIESDKSIGMVGSKLVYPDGRLQEAGGIIWNDASGWNYGRLSDPQESEYSYVKECDYISGAAMMIRHTLWKEIGGFDEYFAPAYYEDTDLAFEVRKHGYKVMLQPASIVVHFEGISNGTDITTGQKSYQVKNAEKFKEKWKNELVDQFNNGESVFLAKDRSKNKKHILVVDHYVPHHDKDAGGKCTYMYLKLFVSLGMKVTFIGDNFHPHQPYTSELQQLGIEVLYGNYYYSNWKKWIEENGEYFDYVYLNRPHISEKYIDLVKKYTDAKIIYFGHDLHYLREYREYQITGEKSKLKSSNEWKEKEFDLFNKADVIHVVGTYEQGILMEEFKDKPVRNIPVYVYDSVRDDVNKNFEKRENIIFVGGFGHPPNADAVIWFAEKIFPSILEKYPNIIWYIVGSKPPESVQKLACKNIVVTGFISDEELADLYEKSRIAVVPLRVGAGVKGKVIEAMYNQIPLITTSIGAEGLSLEENAFIVVDKEDEFADQVIELYENFDKLIELSDNSIQFIKNYFTRETAKKVILSDIEI